MEEMLKSMYGIDTETLSKLDMEQFTPILAMLAEEWCKSHGVYIVDFVNDFKDLIESVDTELGRY